MQLKGNDAIDDLKKLVGDLYKQVRADEERSNKNHESFQGSCTADLKNLNEIIQTSVETRGKHVVLMEEMDIRLEKSKDSLNITQSEISFIKQKLAAAVERKMIEDNEYETRIKENENMRNVISRVLKMFSELKEGANSFLDLKSINFLQMTSYFKKNLEMLQSVRFRALLGFLAQISEKSNNMK
jgi:hypothetical protein